MTDWITLQMQAADLLEAERERRGIQVRHWVVMLGVAPNTYDYSRSCKRPVGMDVLCRMFAAADLEVGLIAGKMAAE